jgi:hypothetical protein
MGDGYVEFKLLSDDAVYRTRRAANTPSSG